MPEIFSFFVGMACNNPFCPVHHSGVRAENWKESEIYALQYWNSTHRARGSEEKRRILDDALEEFLSDYRALAS